MTKPTKSDKAVKPSGKSERADADKTKMDTSKQADTAASPDSPKLDAKKPAAEPGVIATRDTGSGDGAKAAASGGKVTAADSTLVGGAKGGSPAAEPKPRAASDDVQSKRIPDVKPPVTSQATEIRSDDVHGKSAQTPAGQTSAQATSSAERSAASAASGTSAAQVSAPTHQANHKQSSASRSGFWPVVFGGVIAAGVGAAVTLWALPHLPAGWLPEAEQQVDAEAITAQAVAAAQEAAQSAIDAQPAGAGEDISALQTAVDDQATRIAALESAMETTAPAVSSQAAEDMSAEADTSAPQPEPTASNAAPTAGGDETELAGVVEDLRARLETQAAKIEELAARPGIDPKLAATVAELAGRADALEGQIRSAADEASAQLASVQAETTKLQEAASETTKRAEAVAAVAALSAALDKGVSADQAKEALANAGLDAPEALQQDVASVETLQVQFGPAARKALTAVRSGTPPQDVGNFVTNFLKAQTGARSVEPREGSDPDAVLSRANAAVEAGDIATALTELEALPVEAKDAMSDWTAAAQGYTKAQAALSELSSVQN